MERCDVELWLAEEEGEAETETETRARQRGNEGMFSIRHITMENEAKTIWILCKHHQ